MLDSRETLTSSASHWLTKHRLFTSVQM